MSWTKKWGIASFCLALVLTVMTIFGVFCTDKDMSTLARVTELAYAELAVFSGAYAYKERAENKKKMAISLIKELADKYGIESITGIIQSVIQE